MKILIIDDSVSQIKIMEKMVRNIIGVEPILANDAWEGFAILRAIPTIALVVLDNQMPYTKGIDLLKKIRSTSPFEKLPVLISTGEEGSTDEFINSGADRVLFKPYKFSDLSEFISTIKN